MNADRRNFVKTALIGTSALATAAVAAPPELVRVATENTGSRCTADDWSFCCNQKVDTLVNRDTKEQFYRAGEIHLTALFRGMAYVNDVNVKDIGYFVVPMDDDAEEVGGVVYDALYAWHLAVTGQIPWRSPKLRSFASCLRAGRRTWEGQRLHHPDRWRRTQEERDRITAERAILIRLMATDPFGRVILFDDLDDRTDLEGNEWQRRCGKWLRDESCFAEPGTVLGPFPRLSSQESRAWFRAEQEKFNKETT